MVADDNSKQPKKFWVIIGIVGSIASIVSLIWVILEKAPWYVGAISLAVLILSVYLFCRNKSEEYIASCLDNDDFRNYCNEPIYIPLDVQKEDPIEHPNAKRIKLKDTFLGRFFKQKVTIDSHYACIFGDSGAGKTAALVHLLIDYVKKYTYGIRPYDIRLYSMSMGDEELWKKINKDIPEKDRGKYILLLDALDESPEAQQALNNPNITLDSYLQGLVDKTKDFARVVVTCRQQFFPQKEIEPDKVNRRQHWEKYYISPFSDKQVLDFLTKKFGVPSSEPRNEQARKIIFGNKDVFLRPLILSNIDGILDYYGSDKEELTTKEIYEAIVMSWIKNDTDDEAKRNNLLQMSLSLAAYMYKHRINAVDEPQYQKFLKEYSLTNSTNEFRSRSLLHRGSKGYKFSHKSFYDYFLAYWLFLHSEDIGSVQGLNKTLQFYDEILDAIESGNITKIDKILKAQEALKTAMTVGMSTWADRLANQHQYKNAEPRYEIALGAFRQLAFENPVVFLPNVAMTLNNIGHLHRKTHNYDTAAKEYQEALEISRQLASENPNAFLPYVASTLNNLGRLHKDIYDYDFAAKEYQEALEISRQLASENPDAFLPYVATTLNNLAALHSDTHNYDLAAKEYQEALEIRRQLAAENPDTFLPYVASTLNNLATLHSDTHDYDSATEEYQEALEISRELASKNPDVFLPYVASTLNNLGNLHRNIYDYDFAAKEYQEVLMVYRKLAFENPDTFLPYVASTLNNLGSLHKDIHDYDAAAEEYHEALGIYKKLAIEKPEVFLPDVATTLNNLANLHRNISNYYAAAKKYQEALEIRKKLAVENPAAFLPDVATTLNNLANMHRNTRNYDAAAKEYQEALEIHRQLAEENPDIFLPDMAMTLNNMATLIKNTRDYDVAKGYQEALETYQKLAQKNPDAFLTDVDKIQKTTSRLSVLSEETTSQGIDQLRNIVDKLRETLQCVECSLWYVNSVNNSYYDSYDDSGSNTSTKSLSLIHRNLVYDSVYEFNNSTDYVHIISEHLLKGIIDLCCKSDVNSSVGYTHFTRKEVEDHPYLSIDFLEYLDKNPLQYDFIVIPIASQQKDTDIIAILEFCINSEYYRNYTESQWIEMVQTIQSAFSIAFKRYFEHDILIQQQNLLFDLITLQDKHKDDNKEDLFEDVINIIRKKYCPCQGASFFMWDSSEERYNLIYTTGLIEINNGKMRREDIYYMIGEGLTGKTGTDGDLFISDDLSKELKSLHKIKTCESVKGDDSIKTVNHIKTGMFIPIAYPNKPKKVVGILRLINKTNQCNSRFVDYFNYKIDGKVMEMAAKYLSLVCDFYIKQDEQEVFISKMTHELNTPANAIHKSADLLYKNIDDEEFIKQNLKVFLGDIRDLAQMQKWQVATNLQLSKNRKKIPFNTKYNIHEYNLYELILSSKNITKTITSNYGVPFENIHIDNGLHNFRIKVDKNAFITIFYNILTNAIKYNDPNNEFYINVTGYITTDNSEVIRIIVEDHGIGINKKEETAIFEIGYRGENAIKQNAHGYGIGLPVIKQIINDFGGKIYISNYKNPTKFIIDLPKKLLL